MAILRFIITFMVPMAGKTCSHKIWAHSGAKVMKHFSKMLLNVHSVFWWGLILEFDFLSFIIAKGTPKYVSYLNTYLKIYFYQKRVFNFIGNVTGQTSTGT